VAGRVFISDKQQFNQNQTTDTYLVHRSPCIRIQQYQLNTLSHHLTDHQLLSFQCLRRAVTFLRYLRQFMTPLSSQQLRYGITFPRYLRHLRLFRLSVMRKERTILFVGGRNGEFFAYVGCCLLNGLWCTRDQYGKLWVPDRFRSWSPSPVGIPGVDDYFYFYLNFRSMSQGGKFSLC
jgi:hypothetical protein